MAEPTTETRVNRPLALPAFPESNLPSAKQPGIVIAIIDADNDVWAGISDGTQWHKYAIGKEVGELAKYEDDGNGNPVIDHPNAPHINGQSIYALEDWHIVGEVGEPSYENGWESYNTDPTSGWGGAAFYKDPFGVVHLRGLVNNGTADATIFTLPSGYRPQLDLIIAAIQDDTPDTSIRFEVLSNGVVQTLGASSGWISLSGVQFRAA